MLLWGQCCDANTGVFVSELSEPEVFQKMIKYMAGVDTKVTPILSLQPHLS